MARYLRPNLRCFVSGRLRLQISLHVPQETYSEPAKQRRQILHKKTTRWRFFIAFPSCSASAVGFERYGFGNGCRPLYRH